MPSRPIRGSLLTPRPSGDVLGARPAAAPIRVDGYQFGYVVGLLAGEVVARYLVNPNRTAVWIEGAWALEQCAAHLGADWRRTGLDALARWSQVAPQPLAVDQLRPLLTAEHLFPEDPLFGDLPVALGIQPPPEPSPWKRLQRR